MMKLVIGIVGSIGAGKDTAADYLVEKYGFEKFSTSDELRFEWKKRGVEMPNREQMIQLSTELRAGYKKEKRDILTERAVRRMKNQDVDYGLIMEVRLEDGIKYLQKEFGEQFYLIGIQASQQVRFERKSSSLRGDDSDLKDFQSFKEKDDMEQDGGRGNAQEVSKVMALADLIIKNEGSVNDLYERLDVAAKKLIE